MKEDAVPGIREANVERDANGEIKRVRLVFGPHHFCEVIVDEAGTVTFVVGATHHGFIADASDVMSELERIVYEVREAHPETAVD